MHPVRMFLDDFEPCIGQHGIKGLSATITMRLPGLITRKSSLRLSSKRSSLETARILADFRKRIKDGSVHGRSFRADALHLQYEAAILVVEVT